MPRLFISHSSKDNVEALAFRRWLVANGWAERDVFIDLHGIGAGERWRDTLRKANAACEVVVLLASPNSLGSVECEKELELAEALGKPIMPVIVRDLTVKHPRLAPWADRQIVELSQQPTERIEPFEHEGQLHRVEFSVAALAAIKARLADLGIAPGSFAWEPHKRPDGKLEGPFPGLAAFGEDDAGIFFGREADIVAGLAKLRLMRKRRSPRLLVIQAASGAGKSSFLKAGMWPRLKRDADFAPLAILRTAQGIVAGPDGIAQRITPWFQRQRRTKVPGDIEASLMQTDRAASAQALAALLTEATQLATAARRAGVVDARPPAPLLAIDQGEELFAPENSAESEHFLGTLAAVLNDLPEDVDPYVLLTIRADSVEPLLQRWPALGLAAPETQLLPPLSPTAYRDVITKPAEVYTDRVRRLVVEPALADKLAHDATGGDALPLLAFTLSALFEKFGADGNLTLARYDGMGGIGGSIDRALAEAQRQTGSAGTADHLRRLMVPGLATWDPAANAAKRIVAHEAELLGGERATLKPLADALVANRLLTRGAGTLEVAHEALLRRAPIAGWLAEQKDALKLRDDVLREAKEWEGGKRHRKDLVRTTPERLRAARRLAALADFGAAMAPARAYLRACGWSLRRRSAGFALLAASVVGIGGLAYKGFLNPTYIEGLYNGARNRMAQSSYKPGNVVRECSAACPEMVVLPPGEFVMGSPDTEQGHQWNEGPQHKVTIARPFLVSKFEVTFAEWDACYDEGGCSFQPGDQGWGRDRRPVMNVSWNDIQQYVRWLSVKTGVDYRLLTEAEWEYAARGITSASAPHPKYHFGDDEAKLCDYANGADLTAKEKNSNWTASNCKDGFVETAPVGSFKPNAFGLHDMHGNVWEWVQDCYVDTYKDAPTEGKAMTGDASCSRVLRGGSWDNNPGSSARRSASAAPRTTVTTTWASGYRGRYFLPLDPLTSCKAARQCTGIWRGPGGVASWSLRNRCIDELPADSSYAVGVRTCGRRRTRTLIDPVFPRSSRRLLEQQSRQPPRGAAQRQHPGQP